MQALLYHNRISSVNPFASKQMKSRDKKNQESGKKIGKSIRERRKKPQQRAHALRPGGSFTAVIFRGAPSKRGRTGGIAYIPDERIPNKGISAAQNK